MRVPQVKEAPAQALRAMFAGIGQFLSITDKLRGKPAASPDPETVVPPAAPPQTSAPAAAAAETATPETAAAEAAGAEAVGAEAAGGHVRLLEPDEAPAAVAEPTPAAVIAADPAPAAVAAADPAPAASSELPLANYDGLTVASLRARLRNLSADQLGQLIEYEKSHAGRADVISMFERRVAKLAEG